MGDSIVRGALANFSAQPLTWAASLLMAIAVPRLLGSEALGEYTVAFTIQTLAITVLSLGINDYLTRYVAQRPRSTMRAIGLAIAIETLAALAGGVLIAIVIPRLDPNLVDPRLLNIMLIGLIAAPAQGVLLATLRGREQHALYAWLNAGWSVIMTVGGVMVLFLGGDVIAYAAATVVLGIAMTALNWKLSRLPLHRPSLNFPVLRDARALLRGGFPFLSWNVTLTVYGSIDRVLLGALVPTSEVGWYAAAYRVIGSAVFIPTLLTTPLFPALSRSVGDPPALRRAIGQTLRIAMLFTVPLSAGIIALAPVVPSLLGWPDDFANAVPLMMILSLHLPVVAVDMVLGTVLMAIGREGRWVRIGIIAGVFNLSTNWFGIPLAEQMTGNGAIGASVITVATELLMLVGALVLLPKNLLQIGLVSVALRIAMGGVATGLVASSVLPHGLLLAIPAGALTYALVTASLRVLTLDDVRGVLGRLPWPGVRKGF
jgi:O-antigen/teichoic acid export membrane protein